MARCRRRHDDRARLLRARRRIMNIDAGRKAQRQNTETNKLRIVFSSREITASP
jgi:hypothetical protein